jgi:hypothetical protein
MPDPTMPATLVFLALESGLSVSAVTQEAKRVTDPWLVRIFRCLLSRSPRNSSDINLC